jgi:hypothetical protein
MTSVMRTVIGRAGTAGARPSGLALRRPSGVVVGRGSLWSVGPESWLRPGVSRCRLAPGLCLLVGPGWHSPPVGPQLPGSGAFVSGVGMWVGAMSPVAPWPAE